MTCLTPILRHLLAAGEPAALVRLIETAGSTPREAGAAMLVTGQDTAGTIGGGQMEYLAIDEARRMLVQGKVSAQVDLPLGPAIGQCCGGHVRITLVRADEAELAALEQAETTEKACQPHVYLFGAGHVGQALARALAPLPLQSHVVETREAELQGLPQSATLHLTALPEAVVQQAPAGAAFIVLTHDHALDFVITAAALARGDAAYVGLIGSATKRAIFVRWHRGEGYHSGDLAKLTCPIGQASPRDKRPEVIAAFVAPEVTAALHSARSEELVRQHMPVGGEAEGNARGGKHAKT